MILFRDRIKAQHLVETVLDDGSTRQERGEEYMSGVPCQISHEADDRAKPKAKDRLPQEREIKIFVWLDRIPQGEMFRRGDYVVAERMNKGVVVETVRGTIGDPKIYTRGIAHVEISMEAT